MSTGKCHKRGTSSLRKSEFSRGPKMHNVKKKKNLKCVFDLREETLVTQKVLGYQRRTMSQNTAETEHVTL